MARDYNTAAHRLRRDGRRQTLQGAIAERRQQLAQRSVVLIDVASST